MTGFKSIIGQEQPIRFLTILLRKGMIPNALLFTGPEGVGKRRTAYAFAMAANCNRTKAGGNKGFSRLPDTSFKPEGISIEPCGECKSCRKFISGNHPDLILINPQGQITKIAQIRELRQLLTMKPFEGRLRVVIIGEAHTLNPEASNAILKVLEEPPEQTIFVLVTPYTYDLLPTILSRCQIVRFSPIKESVLASALIKDHEMTRHDAEALAAMSGGSYSKALTLKNDNHFLFRNWIIQEIKAFNTDSMAIILAFAEKIAKTKNKESIQDFLDILKIWFRDLTIAEYSPHSIINKDLEKDIASLSQQYSQNLLLKNFSAIEQAQKKIDSNANPRLVLENLMLTIMENKSE